MSTESKPLSKAAQKRAEAEEAREYLRWLLKPGDTVYVIQRHVSSSGMMRRLSLHVIRDNRPIDITHKAALAMGSTFNADDRTIKVGGTGMNMHFATVYGLSGTLFPGGHECTGKRGCPSNDHSNDYGDASSMWRAKMAAEGRQDLDYHQPGGEEQFAEMKAFISEQMADGGPLGYTKGRVHSDGGYALHHETL